MAQWTKALAIKTGDVSQTLGPTWQKARTNAHGLFSDLCTLAYTHAVYILGEGLLIEKMPL